jgi:hypothetical protein
VAPLLRFHTEDDAIEVLQEMQRSIKSQFIWSGASMSNYSIVVEHIFEQMLLKHLV